MERRRQGEDTWQVSARVMEALPVMSLLLLKALVQVFVLLLYHRTRKRYATYGCKGNTEEIRAF